MEQLTRYWITFEYPPIKSEGVVVGTWERQVGFGVTATDVDDAICILRREWLDRHGFDVPPVRQIVEDVDVSELDDQLRPHMNPPNWRGMWFPRSQALG
ncbi:MAG TPA: hypothetical protein VFB25_11645 [Gaiellaceae bacterium]|nr:hypothetical protein [Gaiellaceae bacterium]